MKTRKYIDYKNDDREKSMHLFYVNVEKFKNI